MNSILGEVGLKGLILRDIVKNLKTESIKINSRKIVKSYY